MLKNLKYQKQKINEGNNNIVNIITWVFIIVLIGIIFYLIWRGSQNIYYSLFNSEKAGQIGDSAGLLNSLFSGLAFLGVIVTIILQSKELKQTITELKNQKEEFQIQNQTLKRQQFENTFFNMLKTQENIIYNLEYGYGTDGNVNYKSGRRVFAVLYNKSLKHEFDIKRKRASTIEEISEIYYSIENLQMLDHYFRHMYRIIKFVDENSYLNDKEKSNYIDILRATLSQYEFALLFYNGLCYDKMKIFIERYWLLDNLRIELLYNKNDISFYNKNAYGEDIQKYYDKLLKDPEEKIKNLFS